MTSGSRRTLITLLSPNAIYEDTSYRTRAKATANLRHCCIGLRGGDGEGLEMLLERGGYHLLRTHRQGGHASIRSPLGGPPVLSAHLAAENKCLAQSNKSRTGASGD